MAFNPNTARLRENRAVLAQNRTLGHLTALPVPSPPKKIALEIET